jgi:hypothetical protein
MSKRVPVYSGPNGFDSKIPEAKKQKQRRGRGRGRGERKTASVRTKQQEPNA